MWQVESIQYFFILFSHREITKSFIIEYQAYNISTLILSSESTSLTTICLPLTSAYMRLFFFCTVVYNTVSDRVLYIVLYHLSAPSLLQVEYFPPPWMLPPLSYPPASSTNIFLPGLIFFASVEFGYYYHTFIFI